MRSRYPAKMPIWVLVQTVSRHYLQRVRIPEQADKYPGQLSGGQ